MASVLAYLCGFSLPLPFAGPALGLVVVVEADAGSGPRSGLISLGVDGGLAKMTVCTSNAVPRPSPPQQLHRCVAHPVAVPMRRRLAGFAA